MRSSRSANYNDAGQENDGSRSLKRDRGDRPVAKMDCTLTLVAGRRPVKLVSECLGVSRSRFTVRIKLSVSPKVRRRRLVNDTVGNHAIDVVG
jgi:hypothetical protein